jgi:hypothetical protein
MSSSWGSKLEAKLSTLGETSSTESLQALAKWIGFNRKHASIFAVKLKEAVEKATTGRQNVYLSVIHDVLKQEHGEAKWDRLAELRVTLAEEVIVPILEAGSATGWPEKIPSMLKEWDSLNAFGVPTLINQIRKLLSASKTSTTSTVTTESEKPAAVASSEAAKAVTADVPNEPKNQAVSVPATKEDSTPAATEEPSAMDVPVPEVSQVKPPLKLDLEDIHTKKFTAPTLSPKALQEVTYDFESKDIPAELVKPSDLVEPCRAVATLQIARDLRNDGAVQLSSMLTALPEDVRAECAEAAEAGDDYAGLDEEKSRAFSLKTSEVLLDMDLDEQMQNVRNFRDIVERQRIARKELIHLLIQSRCDFGANDAAAAFYQGDRAKEELKKRKQILMDAMELEGLDVDEEDKGQASEAVVEEELPPFTWYKEEDAMAAKRQRTE